MLAQNPTPAPTQVRRSYVTYVCHVQLYVCMLQTYVNRCVYASKAYTSEMTLHILRQDTGQY